MQDVSYRSGGDTIRGYLVEPKGGDVHGGVVVVHGSGGDRRELLPQARLLAADGIAALAITEPSSARPAQRPASLHALLAQARDAQLADVAAARAGLDYLSHVEGVGGRLGYLGWSSGAKTGALVAARDPRVRGAALLSAGAATVDEFAAQAPPAARGEVRRVLGSVDPIREIARARPGTVLLEDGTRDEVVPRAALENVVRAAPRGTKVRWYDAGHALNERAYRDARDWLRSRLQ